MVFMKRFSSLQFHQLMPGAALLALLFFIPARAPAGDRYLDTLVKLRVAKKEGKRSKEGGLELSLIHI